MDDYDAAAIVGQFAGLDDKETSAALTPSTLIKRFCGTEVSAVYSQSHAPQRDEALDAMVSRGFCGYIGGLGEPLDTGFGDGWEFMGYLQSRGWRPLPTKGDWPYLAYLHWPARDGEPEAIISYCEADLTVWQFTSHEAANVFYRSLEAAP
jgi:hypothetical protein